LAADLKNCSVLLGGQEAFDRIGDKRVDYRKIRLLQHGFSANPVNFPAVGPGSQTAGCYQCCQKWQNEPVCLFQHSQNPLHPLAKSTYKTI